MTENEAISELEKFQLQVEHSIAEEECCEYDNSEKELQKDEKFLYAFDMAISAIKEIQLYKDNKLCLIPEDVYSRQCSELDAYKEIGTVEECREAVEKQKPKKPVKRSFIIPYEGIDVCPNCKEPINKKEHHCKCGQAIEWSDCYHGEGKEWHRTKEAAIAKAEEMRQKKIASLRKQIKKLEGMKFE